MQEFVAKFLKIIIAVIFPNIGGWIGSRYVINNLDWYDKLNQPPFNPPKWLFAPAWTFIYSTIGFASYLVYEELSASGKGFNKTALLALASFLIQLIFNWIWTPLFFQNHFLGWVCN